MFKRIPTNFVVDNKYRLKELVYQDEGNSLYLSGTRQHRRIYKKNQIQRKFLFKFQDNSYVMDVKKDGTYYSRGWGINEGFIFKCYDSSSIYSGRIPISYNDAYYISSDTILCEGDEYFQRKNSFKAKKNGGKNYVFVPEYSLKFCAISFFSGSKSATKDVSYSYLLKEKSVSYYQIQYDYKNEGITGVYKKGQQKIQVGRRKYLSGVSNSYFDKDDYFCGENCCYSNKKLVRMQSDSLGNYFFFQKNNKISVAKNQLSGSGQKISVKVVTASDSYNYDFSFAGYCVGFDGTSKRYVCEVVTWL